MSNPRILVVEDEAAVALDIREKLRRLDYEVAGLASSGKEKPLVGRFCKPSHKQDGLQNRPTKNSAVQL